MTDPAIEAAQRAWAANETLDGIDYNPGEGGLWAPDAMESAAREALKPIRDLHRPFITNDPRSPHDVVCNHCLGPKVWPCSTARFAYTTEELER